MGYIVFLFILPILIFYVDIPLAYWFSQLPNEILYVSNVITKFGSFKYIAGTNVILFIYFFYKCTKKELDKYIYLFYLFSFSIITQGISAFMIQILKCIFGRTRPYHYIEMNGILSDFLFFQTNDRFVSFPSGHSAGTWGFIVCMFFVFGKNKWTKILAMFGMLVPITRMILLKHYLSDILTGSILSSIMCFYCMKWYLKNEDNSRYIGVIKNNFNRWFFHKKY
ncbi:MAG: phosphatase PAP2 family protein [Rickettsiales bacterium]|jgi:membrane-associated phospholipid phosphatase|nr:phosphatase PAP2 family protein [Rickettsiales bacterium]